MVLYKDWNCGHGYYNSKHRDDDGGDGDANNENASMANTKNNRMDRANDDSKKDTTNGNPSI
jgi:hypothetical protein